MTTTILGAKLLRADGSSLRAEGRVSYPLDTWVTVPGHGAYVAVTGGLFSAGAGGDLLATLECADPTAVEAPAGAICYRRVRRIADTTVAHGILDACAEAVPWAALEYAAAHLSPARLDACAEAAPWSALAYAAAHLSPARLDACAEAAPWAALAYAAAHLSPARLDACAEAGR